MRIFGELLALGIDIYITIIIIHVILHWLMAFEVINPRNQQAGNLMRLMGRITDPVMKRVQRYVPPIGGIDLTPLVVIILAQLLKQLIYYIFF